MAHLPRTRPKRPTIKDVAEAAGISSTTVSFVINDVDASISEQTRERVLAAVKELNYRPNAAAAVLRTNRSKSIGFVTNGVASSPFAGEIIHGAQEAAWRSRHLLTIINTNGDDDLMEAAIGALLERRVDGFIYSEVGNGIVAPPPILHEAPTIVVNCGSADPGFSTIVPDEVGGGYTATRSLLDAGHRRIGFLNMDLDPDHRPARGRLEGYQRALDEAGIAYDPDLVNYGNSNADDGYVNAHALMRLDAPPTALFCGTDRMAMGAYDALRELGRSIPGQVSIVGFDDQELIGAYLRPALSTVALPFFEMGWQAVNHLNAHLHDGDATPVTNTVVPCRFIERQSIQAPDSERSDPR